MPLPPKTSRTTVFLLIVLLAVATRFWGLGWSLPYTYHVDENKFAGTAITFLDRGDWNPRFFHVPTLHMYALAGLWKVYYQIGTATGKFGSWKEYFDLYIKAPTPFYLIGRALSALFGIGTILLLYLLGSRMFSPRAGALAALLMVFAPEHNKISHDMLPDVPMVFFLVLTLVFVWNIYKKGRTRDYLLAGLAAGLAMTTKYGGHMMFLPLFLAHLFRVLENGRPKWEILFSPRLIGSGLVFLAVFAAGTPFAVLDFPKFYKEFKWQGGHLLTEGHFGSSAEQPAFLFYLQHGFRENVGFLAQFLVLGGVGLTLARRGRREIILVSYPIVLFLLISTWKARATRYLLPMAPFFVLIGAFFLDAVLVWALARIAAGGETALPLRRLGRAAAVVFMSIVLVAPSALSVFRFDEAMTKPDPRTLAKDWVHFYLPKGTRLAMEMYGPPVSRENYSILYRHTLSQVDLDLLSAREVEYIITADTMSDRFTRYPQDFPREAAFYRDLERETVLVRTFEPRVKGPLLDIHFPTLRVRRLSQAPYYGFPGNFGLWAEDVTLTRESTGGWRVEASVTAEARPGVPERVRDPYVAVRAGDGRELARLPLFEGELPAAGPVTLSGKGRLPDLPEGSVVDLGYEYDLVPNPLSPLALAPGASFRKEFRLPEAVDRSSIANGLWSCRHWFLAVPDTRGEEYFQTVTLAPKAAAASLRSRVFGAQLRYGEASLLAPFVLVRDAAGVELTKVDVYGGKLGAVEADRLGPAQRRVILPGLPADARFSVGYARFFDRRKPAAAGGPAFFELPPPAK